MHVNPDKTCFYLQTLESHYVGLKINSSKLFCAAKEKVNSKLRSYSIQEKVFESNINNRSSPQVQNTNGMIKLVGILNENMFTEDLGPISLKPIPVQDI